MTLVTLIFVGWPEMLLLRYLLLWNCYAGNKFEQMKFCCCAILKRKSRDYVYGIWEYKVLSIYKLFQSKVIWEENNRYSLGNVQRNMHTNKQLMENSSALYQTYKHLSDVYVLVYCCSKTYFIAIVPCFTFLPSMNHIWKNTHDLLFYRQGTL